MQTLARILFFVFGLVTLMFVARTMLNPAALELWRKEDALVGPTALPTNVAGFFAVAFGYFYAAVSPSTFDEKVRWRIAAFIVLHGSVLTAMGRDWFICFCLALFLWLGCKEASADIDSQGESEIDKPIKSPLKEPHGA